MSINEWREKRDFLEKELAKEADATQKFKIEKEINECNKKIQDLEARQSTDTHKVNRDSLPSRSLFEQIPPAKKILLTAGLTAGTVTLIVSCLVGLQRFKIDPQYVPLKKLLEAGKWNEANQETTKKMNEVAARQDGFKKYDFLVFPCEDLRTIEQLWKQYSSKHFGFSVQARFWKQIEKEGKSGLNNWFELREYVGWDHNGKAESSMYVKSIPDGTKPTKLGNYTPKGHFPIPPGGEQITNLFSRMEQCKLLEAD